MISSKIILDSVSPYTGTRLTTIEYTLPKCLLAQLNTHRVFSRLARSSRAISLKKYLQEESYRPTFYGKEIQGMKSQEEVEDLEAVRKIIDDLEGETLKATSKLQEHNLHREYINRYLEPFKYAHGLITSTEWSNFFRQRCKGGGAQDEIGELADSIKTSLKKSKPSPRSNHFPYLVEEELNNDPIEIQLIKSVARCARVSYDNHGKEYSFKKDYDLFCYLWYNKHLSPFEMVAFAVPIEDRSYEWFNIYNTKEGVYYCNNFKEWIQLRINYKQLITRAIKKGERYV